ncbi:CotH kinase family protein [Anatilimnocola floriformis]|uniref:CotH kinase family protein n=1 Tax=Anatilimnocola floriformis TaxID=2948575 RepID=UPI0020C43577|nr:CotH kinase family protein [Anatilimnocola floriformis]
MRIAVAVGLVALGSISLLALAQTPEGFQPPPRQPGGGGPGQGPGGPGQGPGGPGGFFRGPGGPGGQPQHPTATLLGMPEVQEELELSANQKRAITAAVEELNKTTQAAVGAFDPRRMGDMSEDERNKLFAEMRTKSEAANKGADDTFRRILSTKQTKRLDQLRLQREGASAIVRPENVDKLKLSEKQVKLLTEVQARSSAGMGPAVVSPQAYADMLAVLSTDQQQQWTELSGKPFKFTSQPAGNAGRGPGGPGGFGPPGGGGPGGPGGGPFGGAERKLLKEYDKDDNGVLNVAERKVAREFLKTQPQQRGFGPPGGGGPGGPGGGGPGGPGGGGPGGGGPGGGGPGGGGPGGGGPGGGGPGGGGPGGPGGGRMMGGPGGGRREPGKPGPKVAVTDVKPIPDAPLYAPNVLRTIFIEFENSDWEEELEAFHNTDVEVPATLTVDGKQYPNVGIHFRGMSSYGSIPRGSKRSMNLSLDMVQKDQRLYGYKTLNLLNANDDPTFLHTVLFSQISREHIPAPKANLVKVVVNGESWGVYVNAQQFDKVFVAENFPKKEKGTRWKVSGSPGGGGSLAYLGENLDSYKRLYEMKSNDDEKAWKALIQLTKTLNETPPEELEKAIEPLLDVEGALWFLALDNALVNSDGYWIRASDYSIFRDSDGKFHIIAHDMNETMMPGMGPGMGGPGGGPGGPGGRGPGGPGGGPGGPGGGPPMGGGGGAGNSGYKVDPLVGLYDTSKPLRSKLLAVPKYRAKYLANVRTIAEKSLDWNNLGPIVKEYSQLIEKEVAADTRKLSPFTEFEAATGGATSRHSLEQFARERRAYLLDHSAIAKE